MCMISTKCKKPNRRLKNGELRPCDSCASGISRWIRKLRIDPLAVTNRQAQLAKWQDRMGEIPKRESVPKRTANAVAKVLKEARSHG